MTKALLVFLALFVLDFIWGLYIKAVSQSRAVTAAAWSVPIYVIGGLATVQYVQDPWLLLPAGLGSFFGTYCGVKLKITS